MQVSFATNFNRDIENLHDRSMVDRVEKIIQKIESAETRRDMPRSKKLRNVDNAYRIRVGRFRLGFIMQDQNVTLVEFRPRKEMYR